MLLWIRSFLVLQNYLVDPVRCIICTEDKPLQKCIYLNPDLIYSCCSPRAVDKHGAPSVILKVRNISTNLSPTADTQYMRDSKYCNTVQSLSYKAKRNTKCTDVFIFWSQNIQNWTLHYFNSRRNTSTADKCALHCTDISDYKHLHHCIVVKTPSKTM